jgi:hypothetical protein
MGQESNPWVEAKVRPGAMTTAMQAVRGAMGDRSALRIAIARGDRIEREWIVEQGSVTIGRSHEADVFVADHAEKIASLIRIEDGEMTLVVPRGATGRVQLSVGPQDLATLVGAPLVLDSNARGRLVVGGASVLFQRVAPPVQRARPALPASVRGGVFARVDGLFTALVAGSFMLHMGVVAMLSEHDWPAPPSLAVVDDRVADLVFSDPTPPPPDVTDTSDPTTHETSDPTTHETSEPTTTPTHARTTHGEHSSPTSTDPALVADQINTAVQTLIGAQGVDGAIANLIASAQPTEDAASLLAAAATVTPATASVPAMRTGRGGDIGDGTFAPRGASDVGERHEGETPITEHAPHPPHITLATSDDPPDHAIFDDQMLVRALRARMPQIQACYEHQLTRQPGLAGRMEISMQVERIGILSHVAITDDTVGSPELEGCVVRTVEHIRLATGPSEPVTVTYPIVFAPQQ